MEFDGFRDWMVTIAAIILLIVAALAYFNVGLPSWIVYVVGAAFVLGGLFGIFNSFSIDNGFFITMFLIASLALLIMGVNVFYAIPYLSGFLAVLPVNLTSYIVNVVIAVLLFIIAFASE